MERQEETSYERVAFQAQLRSERVTMDAERDGLAKVCCTRHLIKKKGVLPVSYDGKVVLTNATGLPQAYSQLYNDYI